MVPLEGLFFVRFFYKTVAKGRPKTDFRFEYLTYVLRSLVLSIPRIFRFSIEGGSIYFRN